jgi:hypothetical protein
LDLREEGSLYQSFYGYQIKKDEMGDTCSMHDVCDKCIRNLVCKPEMKRPFEIPGNIDRRKILKWFSNK